MTRRFLDPTFEGDHPGDKPLRDELLAFIWGTRMADLPNLSRWVGALRLIRIVERMTEGIHRDIKQVFSRAPSASDAYLSTELRSEQADHELNKPDLLQKLCEECQDLVTMSGKKQFVAFQLGGAS
eukprot:1013058-Karenia_brevis.AAC.1